MSELESSSEQMAWNEGEEMVVYRQVSRLALGSMAAALFSFLAFASPVLWIVPVIGVVVAAMALVTIKRNATLTGARIATVALAFCSFNCIAAPTQQMARRARLASIAQAHFDTWRKLVIEDNRPLVHQMTLSYSSRSPVGANLTRIYKPRKKDLNILDPSKRSKMEAMLPSKHADLTALYGTSGMKLLLTAKGEPEYVGMTKHEMRIESELLTLHYHVPFEVGGKTVQRNLFVEFERRVRGDIGESHWRVSTLSDPDGTDDPVVVMEEMAVPATPLKRD